ncbi:MAG: nicotinamide-nucleotide amidohydrolase family protein, partial [Candidatus Limnocylindria bacterium]|nr:nicotinamide-nucleotide amidohydrolase family protein [Candidatus Limnocylindria bacterium]
MPKASVTAAAARRSAPTYADLAARTRALQPRLRRKRLTVATAESCTGGLLGALLTEHGGASGVYLGGAIAYADAAKESLAGVPPQLLHAHGAVSAVVAGALARGIRARLGAKVGLG